MTQYLITFFSGAGLVLSFAGLGYLLNLSVFRGKKFDFGFQVAFGLGIFLVIGGYLNLFKMISPFSLLGILSIGLLAKFFSITQSKKIIKDKLSLIFYSLKKDKIILLLAVLVLGIFLLRYAAAVSFFQFHQADDYHGYLVFPAKMIQTGSLGNDPFSERRIVSSFGGGYLLDAVVLSFASFKNLHLIDNGFGLLLLIILLWYFSREAGLSEKKSLLLIFLLLLIPTPSANVTIFFLAAALFFALFRLLYCRKGLNDWQRNLAVSLIVCSLIILKTNMIIPALTLFFYFFISTFYQSHKKIWLKNIFLTLVIFSAALLPWMISMYQSCHTLLYPFLGKGYYGTSYGDFAGSFLTFNFYSLARLFSELFASLCLFMPLFIFGFLVFKSNHKKKSRLLFIFGACLLGIAAIIYGVGGYSLYYYTFPFVLPAVFFLLVALLSDENNSNNKFSTYAMLIAAFMAGVFLQKVLVNLNSIESNLSFDNGIKIGLINSEMVKPEELAQYKNLQLAVAPNETILARLDRNFLFDFKRNNIFIIDLPGGASLPPGLPFRKGGEKMANYFLAAGIKYVAYSYGNEANFPKKTTSGMLRAHVNPWLKTETEHSLDFQDNLMELSKTRKIIYDDGKNFVLDLSMKK